MFDSLRSIPPGLVFLLIGFIAMIALRVVRARQRAIQRVLEKPNSHYTSPLVRESETRHRWHDMAIDRIHEINGAEVNRLLAKVDATGAEALRPNEREFLDRMAELAGTKTATEPTRNAAPRTAVIHANGSRSAPPDTPVRPDPG